ncbi:GNAT family N-acetyltransferase [Geomicrobium sp. JCM 19038]|uniref:GNAT family N-acetyltransferase n=1 Tax=Geomicrobium sp. JCM 19038 TaxID=1460635 RepID=UPI00045F2BD2|nr:GNAT family N-acetyltransferase [Geomicrobium sp. JCM 19038]GAK08499.1 hypothetical protein JCM19038_2283 [Geomicrobium sp. JCM 19038]
MNVYYATPDDATIVCTLMHDAFAEYKHATPSSSALLETPDSVREGLNGGEKALIGMEGDKPVAMLRYVISDDDLYFFRLSVPPENQGNGYAKKLITALEAEAKTLGKQSVSCRVRTAVDRNMVLYQRLGYETEEIVTKNIQGIHIDVATVKKPIHSLVEEGVHV